MPAKTSQLQIRVTPRQKAALKRRAAAAGLDVSSFVLARALPADADRFTQILGALGDDASPTFAFAELNDFLTSCAAPAFTDAVALADLRGLPPYHQNYVAAMVEQAARMKRVAPPAWVGEITPLATPHFATSLKSLRAYLLGAAPVAFKRRNIFVDVSIGGRV